MLVLLAFIVGVLDFVINSIVAEVGFVEALNKESVVPPTAISLNVYIPPQPSISASKTAPLWVLKFGLNSTYVVASNLTRAVLLI